MANIWFIDPGVFHKGKKLRVIDMADKEIITDLSGMTVSITNQETWESIRNKIIPLSEEESLSLSRELLRNVKVRLFYEILCLDADELTVSEINIGYELAHDPDIQKIFGDSVERFSNKWNIKSNES